jgi:hypothetical protein
VKARLQRSARKLELEDKAFTSASRVCFKIPDIVPRLSDFLALYPGVQIIIMRRGLEPTIRSLLAKGWFDPGPQGDRSTRIYPFSSMVAASGRQCHLPFWVNPAHSQWWVDASAELRCLYYYLLNTPAQDSRFIIVDYEKLVEDPKSVFDDLCHKLHLTPGDLTASILSSIRPQPAALAAQAYDAGSIDLSSLAQGLPLDVVPLLSLLRS